jgi:hypothetical protein
MTLKDHEALVGQGVGSRVVLAQSLGDPHGGGPHHLPWRGPLRLFAEGRGRWVF